jgi:sugar/nucleoside kinase (ribokinase family)
LRGVERSARAIEKSVGVGDGLVAALLHGLHVGLDEEGEVAGAAGVELGAGVGI